MNGLWANELGYFQAIFLGVVQGLAEFLPVSSSGHLALTQRFLALDPDSTPMLLFDLVAHVGTIVAVGIVFRRSATLFLNRLFRELRRSSAASTRAAIRLSSLALLTTILTGAIGLWGQKTFEAAFDKPTWIAGGLFLTGCLLAVPAKLSSGKLGWRKFHWWHAALIGLVQSLAIFPGISRSGTTICVATYCGWRRRWAAEFSFLIAVPAVLGGALVKLKDTLELPRETLRDLPVGPVLLGGIVSCLVGVIALRWLLSAVRKAKLHYFALYCWSVSLLIMLWIA